MVSPLSRLVSSCHRWSFSSSRLSHLKKSIERIHTHLKPRYNVKQDQPFLRLMHATLAIMDLYLRVELRVFTSLTPHSTKMRSVPFVCSIEHFCLMFLSTKKVLFSLKNVINFYDWYKNQYASYFSSKYPSYLSSYFPTLSSLFWFTFLAAYLLAIKEETSSGTNVYFLYFRSEIHGEIKLSFCFQWLAMPLA